MTRKKVWLITGAGRGVDIAKAVLASGDAVVATGRDAARVEAAVGRHENTLPVPMDVTRPRDAHAAVEAALAEFERIGRLIRGRSGSLRPSRPSPAPPSREALHASQGESS
jgi:NAD(P)-dependent dehydrogenase (short-subunit alcohol dehydrogenase family)